MLPTRTHNTRSAVIAVALVGIAAVAAAFILGPSEKPAVRIGVIAGGVEAAAGGDADRAPVLETGEASAEVDGAPDVDDEVALAPEPTASPLPAATAPAATATPEPTAEIVAVVPTPEPTVEPAADSLAPPRLPVRAGSVEGAFFTRPDEEAGADVRQNLVEVSFEEDGSGSFRGVLDITYGDGTTISLDMSGPLEFTTDNPQVSASVTGSYSLDAADEADDVASDEAELSITSLESGSGSLCASKCFGFTFPPQIGP